MKEHVNPAVAERRSWAKFGLEKGHAAGPSFDTTSVGENIVFRPSVNWKAQAKEEEKAGEKGGIKDQLKDKKVKCRICSGEHFTARCPFKDTMAPVDEPAADGAAADFDLDDKPAGGLGAGSSSYVPPHMRKGGAGAGAGAGDKLGSKYEKDDLATLRVTNVSPVIFSLRMLPRASVVLHCVRQPSFCMTDTNPDLGGNRYPSWRRSKSFGISSNGSVVLREFSWPETEKRNEPRGSPSSVSQTGAMRRERARSWMAVGFPCPVFHIASLTMMLTFLLYLQSVIATLFSVWSLRRGLPEFALLLQNIRFVQWAWS